MPCAVCEGCKRLWSTSPSQPMAYFVVCPLGSATNTSRPEHHTQEAIFILKYDPL